VVNPEHWEVAIPRGTAQIRPTYLQTEN